MISIADLKQTIDPETVMNAGLLYDTGIATNNDEHFARMGHWHPSSAGGCMRAEVWQFLREPPTDEHSKEMKVIFEIGHLIHDMVQTRFETLKSHMNQRGLNYEFQREVPFDPATDTLYRDLDIGGTCDGVLRLWNDSFEQRGVLEVKSISPDGFKALSSPTKPAMLKHLKQSHLYAYRFDLPIIWVFYVNKSSGDRLCKTHLFDQSIFESALSFFDTAADHVRAGTLPPRPGKNEQGDYLMCKECLYRTKCKPPVNKLKQLAATPQGSIRRRG